LDFNQILSNNNNVSYKKSDIGYSRIDLNNQSQNQLNSKSYIDDSERSNIIIPSSAQRLKGLEEYIDDNVKESSREIQSKAIDSKNQSKLSALRKPKKKLKSNWDDEYL